MKVKIGRHTNWVGPYHLVDWFKPIFGEKRIDKFQETKVFNKFCDLTMPFFQWIEDKKKRKVEIKIDTYDTWNMDHTLALIILPMLKQLKADKHGYPLVADKDVPARLRSKKAPPVNDWETDDNAEARWDWVMDELIWTFTQLVDDDNDDQFHTGNTDIVWKPTDIDGNDVAKDEAKLFEMTKGPDDTHVFKKKAYMKHNKRIARGLVLFGRYYRGLWD